MPAKAGFKVHSESVWNGTVDSRLRGNDNMNGC